MIKFLHAADLHLDSPFAGLSPQQAVRQRQAQRDMLNQLSKLCKAEQCQLLFLSGDLFDGQRIYRETLDCLRDALSECGAEVFIAPGNHDYLCRTSPYLNEAWPDHVHIFTTQTIDRIHLDSLNCSVYGAAFTAPTMDAMLTGFHTDASDENTLSFLVLHGDTMTAASPYNPIAPTEIAKSGLDYLALGHIHQTSSLYKAGKTAYAWPGCPMGRGFDETGEKGVILGEAEKGAVHCRFHALDVRRYEVLRVEAGADPLSSIQSILPPDAAKHSYRIILTGEHEGIQTDALYRKLEGQCYSLQLVDQTLPPLELWSRCGEMTLEGMSLHTLKQALERCETDAQRRTILLAARRIAEVCEGREIAAL